MARAVWKESVGFRLVEWADVVRGYDHRPGEFVVLSRADLERASPEATKRIERMHFAGKDEIDPVDYDQPHHLEPAQKDGRACALLRATLAKTLKVGIAEVALRTRRHLAALSVRPQVIVLESRRANAKRPDAMRKRNPRARPAKQERSV